MLNMASHSVLFMSRLQRGSVCVSPHTLAHTRLEHWPWALGSSLYLVRMCSMCHMYLWSKKGLCPLGGDQKVCTATRHWEWLGSVAMCMIDRTHGILTGCSEGTPALARPAFISAHFCLRDILAVWLELCCCNYGFTLRGESSMLLAS